MTRERLPVGAIAADVVAVVVFVAVGRSVHDHGVSVTGLLATSAPFLVGLVAGWWVSVARAWPAAGARAGVTVWLATVLVGLALRALVGQGVAPAFIVVAALFLGLFQLGWRAALARRRGGRGDAKTQGDGGA